MASGITYLADDRLLVVLGMEGDAVTFTTVALPGDPAGALAIRGTTAAATGLASDGRRLFIARSEGVVEQFDIDGGAAAAKATAIDVGAFGIAEPTGLGFDRGRSALLVPDPAAGRVLRLGVGVESSPPRADPVRACELRFATGRPTAVAVRGTDGHVFVALEGSSSLMELAADGQLLAEVRVAGVSLGAVRAIAFAPTADPTDKPNARDLYLVTQESSGVRLHVIGAGPATPMTPRTVVARIVDAVSTATMTPPSSDPGGIAWDEADGRFLVTDSDIDEGADYAQHVVFGLGSGGEWTGLGVPTGTHEVTDIAIDPPGRRWFLSDDGADLIVEMVAGEDGEVGTADDRVRPFDTTSFGSEDPEGLAFGQRTIFVSDGEDAEIYRLAAGRNGFFDGTAPGGDDTVTSFDTTRHGVTDPESVAYDQERGTLFVMSRRQQEPIIEVTTEGELVTIITVEGGLVSPAGLTLVPPVDGTGARTFFVADRGEDNARSHHPNDGRIVELQLEI